DLRTRLLEIYNHVSMDVTGARMILDAMLLALPKLVTRSQTGLDIAIMPELRLAPTDGVQITNSQTGYQLWLTGSVDYAVIKYTLDDDGNNKGKFDARLLGSGGLRKNNVLKIARGRLFLVKAKRENPDRSGLASYVPEAVSQAMAVIKSTGSPRVRYCLSNGATWLFCLLMFENNQWRNYVAPPLQLKDRIEASDEGLRLIVQLLLEWV
ncbi:hypothetical protein FKP32DRAFT_1535239, partial [Trametes sanguinea]